MSTEESEPARPGSSTDTRFEVGLRRRRLRRSDCVARKRGDTEPDHLLLPGLTRRLPTSRSVPPGADPESMGEALDRMSDRAGLVTLSSSDVDAVLELAGRLDRSPKRNWVEDGGGLPKYIEDIAVSLHEKRGMSISQAIAVAVSRVKRWAAGGENVEADTRAKAAKAVAQWEALKARAKAKDAAK